MRSTSRRVAFAIFAILLGPDATAAQTASGPAVGPLAPEVTVTPRWSPPSLTTQNQVASDDLLTRSHSGWVVVGVSMTVAATFGYVAGAVGENVGVDRGRMMVAALTLGALNTVVFCVRSECRW